MPDMPPMRALLAPKTTTATELAVLVKCLPNIAHCAELIEDYARSKAAEARYNAMVEMRGIIAKTTGEVNG